MHFSGGGIPIDGFGLPSKTI